MYLWKQIPIPAMYLFCDGGKVERNLQESEGDYQICLPKEPSGKRREEWQSVWLAPLLQLLSMKFSWVKPVVHSTETFYFLCRHSAELSWGGFSRHWASCTQCSLQNHIHLSKYHFFIQHKYFSKIKWTLKSTFNQNRHYLTGKQRKGLRADLWTWQQLPGMAQIAPHFSTFTIHM